MKIAFYLLVKGDQLWVRLLRAKYRWWNAHVSPTVQSRCTPLWRGVCRVWSDVAANISWNIGDGKGVRFWFDSWLGSIGPIVNSLLNGRQLVYVEASVSDMMDSDGQWRWHRFKSLLPYAILLRIATVKISSNAPMQDFPRWNLTSHGQFRVHSTYSVRMGVQFGPTEPLWKAIPDFKGIPRIRTFIWLACLGKVLTNEVRCRRHMTLDSRCHTCGFEVETIDHILRRCPVAYSLWCSLVCPEHLGQFFQLSFKEWIFSNLTNFGFYVKDGTEWELLFGSLIWLLWNHRNEHIFEPKKMHWEPILSHGKRLQQECRSLTILARQSSVVPALARDSIRWEKPPEGWCKLNTDGAVMGELGMTSCGGVIRSD
ncbi:hypothetical protein V6N12_066200 [Hibiscus sabdariffa]|uniref:Reverse transcriptase zinc-binding domain-containing protein n=1 Tax=Hibiscus sabdariffa TaxID=183260 RepID=A0ABR2B922_9ROSI